MENHTIIKVKDLYKSFETGGRYTNVLKRISVDISVGDFVIVFGPSGCGKSTLLHIIMGLEVPDAGSVSIGGMNLWSIAAKDRANIRKREIGIMYQQQNWIKSLSVVQNIAFSGQLIGMEKDEAILKAQTVLEMVGMNSRTEYIPSELSAGEQQKIGLARALMANPKIIIADEPTGNLDVRSGQDMMNLFRKLKTENKTVIMVTHNPEYLKYADKVLLMLDGKLKREIKVEEKDSEAIQKEISEDLKKFIESGITENEITDETIPAPIHTSEREQRGNVFKGLSYSIFFNLRFLLQTFMFLSLKFLNYFGKKFGYFKKLSLNLRKKYASFCRNIDNNRAGKISASINTLDLMEISFQNLLVKRSRTLITIIGMGLGIGFIVLLLSIGYGLERLIINEITRIQDMRQIDIMPTVSSNILLDEHNVKIINKIEGIEEIMPLVNLAARVEYQKSNTDVVIYGVQKAYLESSNNITLSGTIFDEKEEGVILNQEFLTTIGSLPEDVIGNEIKINFVVSGIQESNVEEPEEEEKIETVYTYKITGVVDDGNPSVLYVPILDMEKLGIQEFSQLRIVVKDDFELTDIRRQIEALGFETVSVMDTVSEVENLFGYAKISLILVGGFALSIAILGMFNTLTVSLLERTREVGLMKTIGMQTEEISSLFINESMLMGIAGGSLGIFIGFLIGTSISIVLSIFSIAQGGSFIFINFLPIYIVLSIVLASTFVGFLTGLYPSRRAVRMSALDALRYE